VIEFNPNHAVTGAAREQWHKIAALLLHKFDLGLVTFTAADIEAFAREQHNIVIKSAADGLHVWLVNDAEAQRLARDEGGLPQ